MTAINKRARADRPKVYREDADIVEYTESREHLANEELVKAFITECDRTDDPHYRGVTASVISRGTGISPDKVSIVLNNTQIKRAGLWQERYSMLDKRVRTIPKSEWPKNVTPPRYVKPLDPRHYIGGGLR